MRYSLERREAILTMDEVVAYLQARKRTAHLFAVDCRFGGIWRFRRSDLDSWIASRIGRTRADDDKGAA